MRRIALLLAAMGVMGAACAGTASATPGEFVATQHAPAKEFPTKGVSGTAGHQALQLGSFTVSCAVARSANMQAHQSESLALDVSLLHCVTPVQIGGKKSRSRRSSRRRWNSFSTAPPAARSSSTK